MSTKQETKTQPQGGEQQHHEEEEIKAPGCGILGRYPVMSVIGFAVVGIAIGVGLSFWEPENPNDKATAMKWIGLVGDLFIRALKAIVLPLVFVNVTISVIEMMDVGKASSIGWKTIVLYLFTTLMAAIFGIISSVAFVGLYKVGDFATETVDPLVNLQCAGGSDSYLTESADGSVYCSANATGTDVSTQFLLEDINGVIVTKSSGGPAEISLSDTIYSGVFTKIVTDNIFTAFTDGNFAAVVFFAILFGIALARVLNIRPQDVGVNAVLHLFRGLDPILLVIINWIIAITPFAVLSLIAKAVGSQSDLGEAFKNVGLLVCATIVAMILQVGIVYIGGLAFIFKASPFPYLKCIIPAQTMAFASASSAATIPMTLKSVISTGRVPEPIAKFIVPLGATVNMDGGAIYFPCACIWLAVLNGITPTIADYILLVILATIGSAGTAPVPSASLVLIITAYNTVFNTTGVPNGFSFIFAIDWFVDRLRTVCNVTGDTVVTGIISHITPVDGSHGTDEEQAPGMAKADSAASSQVADEEYMDM